MRRIGSMPTRERKRERECVCGRDVVEKCLVQKGGIGVLQRSVVDQC